MPSNEYIVKSPVIDDFFASKALEKNEKRFLNTQSLEAVIALYPPLHLGELIAFLCALFFHGRQKEECVVSMLDLLGALTYKIKSTLDPIILRLAAQHGMLSVLDYLFAIRPYADTEHMSSMQQEDIDALIASQDFRVLRDAATFGQLTLFKTVCGKLSTQSQKNLRDNRPLLTLMIQDAQENQHVETIAFIVSTFSDEPEKTHHRPAI